MDALIGEVLQQVRGIARDVLQREGVRLRTATVTQTDPVRITYDGEDDASVVPPRRAAVVALGDRVVVAKSRGQATILGVLGGGSQPGGGAHSPREGGIDGDGQSDESEAWESFLAGLPEGAVVQCPEGDQYRLDAPVRVQQPVIIRGGEWLVADDQYGLHITSGGVTVEDATLTGSGNGQNTDQRLIYALGTDSALLDEVTIRRCTLTGGLYSAIWLEWVRNFEVTDCVIEDVVYAAVMVASAKGGTASRNRIARITQGTLPQCYGIAVTDRTNNNAGRSEDVLVDSNIVTDVEWEALDTHSGRRIHFTSNVVNRCGSGISVLSGNSSRRIPVEDCVVTGNTISFVQSNPQDQGAIKFHGAQDDNRAPASGTITGNTVRGYDNPLHVWNVDREQFGCSGNSHPEVSWTDLPLRSPGWQDGPDVLQYMVDGNAIHLRGAPNKDGNATTGSTNTVGTLPEDYRPTDDRYLSYTWASSGDNTGLYRFRASGELQLLFESNPGSGGGYFPISASVSLT
ncbi:right-handed parallel beta-helix repeat-containing protein [Brachybacterium tyrofermentans]|uniref:right-handed parallel beta-helix repeat-containing protein n=1 Tax=Brachybacterium tyrofermentans TaxID=47848 RepID=UPI001D02FCB8|nr:right-handed parallel beta-helix repeat-containing protein [Brachybacterium tyrofermentans]